MNVYRRSAVWFTLPVTLALFALLIYPLLSALWSSLNAGSAGGASRFVGLGNYADLFASGDFLVALGHTLVYTLFSTLGSFLVGLSLALAMQLVPPTLRWVSTLLILPLAVMPVVSGLTWGMMLNPSLGVINSLLVSLHLSPQLWATDTTTALPTLIGIDIWQWFPFCYLILYAGLQALPHEPYEAAFIDGATRTQQLLFITVPLLMPIILITLTFRMMEAFRAFDVIYVITQGGPGDASKTLLLRAYEQGFLFHNLNVASVYGVVILIVTTVVARYAARLIVRGET